MRRKARRAVFNSKDALRFLVRFNLFAVPLYVILLTKFEFLPLMQLTTQLAFALLRVTGIGAELDNYIIRVPVEGGHFGAFVSWDSTGWKSMLALFALIFATAAPLRKKLRGLVLIPVVYAINLARIWFMFYIATVNIDYFDIAHITVWSWGLIIAILLLWFFWLKKF